MKADKLIFIIVNSGLEQVDKLNERIYEEAERDGYYNLVTETKSKTVKSVTIFKNLKNPTHIKTLAEGYEYINDSDLSFGKVTTVEKYKAVQYTGSPTRIRIVTEFNEICDLPIDALEHLGLE